MKRVKQLGRRRRHLHIRHRLKGTSKRPRVVVFRSNRHIYAQVVDDYEGRVLTGVSSLSPAFRELGVEGDKKAQAAAVGKLLAGELKKRGVARIVFDRAGFKYHGRVKALAEAARKEGLEF
ncbi:50S ribosomal protein L18 [candidate division TA06 bacterium B3_TA06]|uniref:Large ribosomal subunit protein uL18 n=1 Tax=candidate division TA06 bacterium B3_TA06 TaxID=2012487 RepID=A0A532V455_UNCT6|nr:MAG: 50S ribosomal protein L18 [candidate division TA06 bacterium B3_TA06]